MTRKFISSQAALGTLMGLLALSITPATHAQGASGQQASSTTDKDLQAFAKAYVEYHKIRQTYETRLSKIQDAKEREKIQHEGDGKVKKALEKQGLTPESYNKLFTSVNNNEQLRKKTLKIIEEERKRS